MAIHPTAQLGYPTHMQVRVGNPPRQLETRLTVGLLGLLAFFAGNVRAEDTVYLRDVKPVLKAKCYSCHGAIKQGGGLRLDTAAAILAGGENGPGVQIGDAGSSLIVHRVTADEADRMPPEGSPLTADQLKHLRQWIENGARPPANELPQSDPKTHWAFRPLTRSNKAALSIDTLIANKLREAGLSRNEPATSVALVRRLFLDLHGLPPTPSQIETWTTRLAEEPGDRSAVAELVDTLLASPRYGERWAQHWLDVVRYADTHGYEVNTPRPNAWPYRDYVIRAFNDDKPYDEFIVDQLAGDATGEDAATGFLVAAAVLLPGQIGKDEPSKRLARQDSLDEIVVGTTATFLGLTVGCARCHDHKFDPLSQRDYYTMQAFFAGVEYGEREIRDTTRPERLEQANTLAGRIAEITKTLRQFEPLAFGGRTFEIDDNQPPDITRTRAPVNPAINIERFRPTPTRFVRFTTFETIDNNKHEPCIDELEVFTTGESPKNVALSKHGTAVTSSGNYSNTGKHQLKHINDGRYSNDRSWISNERGGGWVQLDFQRVRTIDRIEWARDRTGKFKDRLPTRYRIDISANGSTWTTVAGSRDRLLPGTPYDPAKALQQTGGTKTVDAAKLIAELKTLEKAKAALEAPRKIYGGTFRKPDVTHLLNRGDPEQPLDAVTAHIPKVLGSVGCSEDESDQDRRLKLARWIASEANPLTARVMVNRVWQYHFGRGLVDTPSDFGLNGTPPTNPELLDGLARMFIDGGWSIKKLHRLILTSATYQQSSQINARAAEVDGDSRLLWRFPSRRLEAEAIRDSVLAVSGKLNLKTGGPGFSFFKTRGGLSGFPPIESFGKEHLRRMVYSHRVRMELVPIFGAFDCPDAGQPTPRRTQSTTAIQALNLFNSPFMLQQSEALALRVKQEADDPDSQIQRAWLLTVGRIPTDSELAVCQSTLEEHGLTTVCRALLNSNEFLFVP